jgi:hypothetical protein
MARDNAPRLAAALLVLAALLHAPAALAERDPAAQAACLAKQLRKHGGPEGGRASALKAHFDCFPEDAARFSALFEGDGALAAVHSAHIELFFAARGAVREREWCAKALGASAGAAPGPAAQLVAGLLREQKRACAAR